MKVYVVHRFVIHEGTETVEIFSSMEKAEAFVASREQSRWDYDTITEYEVK